MSKTYRRTVKGHKRDWLPIISRWDIETDVMWRGIWLPYSVDCRKQRWLKNNPHRRKDVDDWFYEMTTPSCWNKLKHTKPRRCKEKELTHNIFYDKVDPENVVWPNGKKPHIYYW